MSDNLAPPFEIQIDREPIEAEIRKFFAMSEAQRKQHYNVSGDLTGYKCDKALANALELSRSTVREVRMEMYEDLPYVDAPWRIGIPDEAPASQKLLGKQLEELIKDGIDLRGLIASAGVSRVEIDRLMNHDPIEPRLEESIRDTIHKMQSQTRGACIRQIRQHLGLSGPKFARMIGVDASTLSRWENQHTHPAGDSIQEAWERCHGIAFKDDRQSDALVAMMRGDLRSLLKMLD